ncbi:LuxR C-terminal-related transcriptional regulator [Hydrogenophaga sp. BPS33]|uniref:LuxR C-terminal-related transcriptional regulator n=1 Tax=Hydrogenophaga sp. BPS33 TaxID=2651974 RepID=UPI00131FBBEA|nr:LuxR C-terminal-related transcriptional regulator [Hydrogenophaga sp. BPS33]QHE83953.1 helix-turn-helix transcriptional regulator [Hydrogenophaga sp. BPS33]
MPSPAPSPRALVSRRKLSPPGAVAAQVRREAICALVAASRAAQLVLVRGPAGFGKTTALAQCRSDLQSKGVRTAWLTLDAADNDPTRFLNGLAEALGALGASAPSETTPDALLRMMDEIGAAGHAFAIFLDDVETVQDPVVLSLVRELVDNLPRQGQVFIGSRVTPELGTARMRARGQLVEISVDALRFSLEETQAFFGREGHVALAADAIELLHHRTEGWVAALWLASMALQRHPEPSAFVERFSGSSALIADYLAEDVLNAQPPAVRDFLLRSSVLHRLDAEICDAVLGAQGGAAALERIAASGLFLLPVHDGRSYRYHSLFSAFLRGQMVREMPAEIPRLHLDASKWYEQRGQAVAAIEHALQGGHQERAIALLEPQVDELLKSGRMRLLARWFTSLPEDEVTRRPTLCMARIWAVCLTTGPWDAMRLLDRSGWTTEDPPSRPHVLALRPLLLGMMDRYDEALPLGRENLRAMPTGNAFADSALATAMAHTFLVMGQYRESHRLLQTARMAHAGPTAVFNRMFSETVDGILDLEEGQLRRAAARFRLAVHSTAGPNVTATGGNAYAGVQYAGVLFEMGDLDQAERLLNVYVPMASAVGLRDQMIIGHVMLARMAFDRRQLDRAWELLSTLEQAGYDRHLPRITASARLERAHLLVLQGNAQASRAELVLASQPDVWERAARLRFPAHDIEDLEMGWLRWNLAFGDATSAEQDIARALARAQAEKKLRRALKLQVLQALALQRLGQAQAAVNAFAQLLSQAAAQGFVRLLIDEGEAVRELAVQLQMRNATGHAEVDPIDQEHLDKILRLLGAPRAEGVDDVPDADKLTPKELRMLRLLADGFSNSELAVKLFVSDSTVRTHLRNINQKLNAGNRTQAVAIARKLGLI